MIYQKLMNWLVAHWISPKTFQTQYSKAMSNITLEISVMNGILEFLGYSNVTITRNGAKTLAVHGVQKFINKAIDKLQYIG